MHHDLDRARNAAHAAGQTGPSPTVERTDNTVVVNGVRVPVRG